MSEQDAIAQEAVWEAEAEQLDAAIVAIDEEYEPQIDRLAAELDSLTERRDALADPLRAMRQALWDQIYTAREARGEPVPMMWKLTRWTNDLNPIETPFLDAFPRKVTIGEPE